MSNYMNKSIIRFTKQKDYENIRSVGRGGLGKTILMRDSEINEFFICKKYEPYDPLLKEEYYTNFKNEIKLMYRFYHKNIIRIFNYHLYPEQFTGYIVMEYVEGQEINEYLRQRPEKINDVFYQTIEAFCYLEENGINFENPDLLNKMIQKNEVKRISTFSDIKSEIDSGGNLIEDLFDEDEKSDYRYFTNSLIESIAKIKGNLRFYTDYDLILKELNDIYKANMLDEKILNMATLINVFINVPYSYWKNKNMPIWALEGFIGLVRSCDDEKFSVLLLNLQNKIKTIEIEIENDNVEDDIPF